jgi:integrase
MPRKGSITAKQVQALTPGEKPYKRGCGDGLLLIVNPDGSKWWRFKYRFGGKERGFSLGTYPEVSLAEARDRADDARRSLRDGNDPAVARATVKLAQGITFQSVAEEWLAQQATKLSKATLSKARWMLEDFVYPRIGSRPVGDVQAQEILGLLRGIEQKGHHETAHRTRMRISQVIRYAIATGRAERDPTQDLRGALAPIPTENRVAVTDPAGVGALLRAIDGYEGQPATMAALKLAPLVFVRPNELHGAKWSEIDLDAREWRIPGKRMKMGERHIVPLSTQAVEILRQQHRLTGTGEYVFPSLRSNSRPISNNTINGALRRLGYAQDEMTGHGFRAMASTLLNERGFPPDIIELQLAHAERNKVRAAYNRAERLPERRKMMQDWADYLDELRRTETKTKKAA